MSDDREKLKALLLSEEMAQIQALHELLNNPQKLSQKISEVLDPATDLAIANNPKFQKKFSKIDPKSYVRAIKANKDTFIDALLPIIGPMIRKSVTSAIRRFVADVNRAVELGFSAKALKWRWMAFRTGVPFAEIVFNNTIEYQVQQVFLIDNHTGLLIEYAGHEQALLQDKDAMSAMLTAIQDFVKDSVSSDGEGLSAAELGDNLVWMVHGNQANMAVVIKGAPTQRLHDTIVETTEHIHIDFHQVIEDPNLWNNNPELKLELEKLLLTKTQSDNQAAKKSINIWPWLLIIVGLIGWWSWSNYQHRQLHHQLASELKQTAGFILSELTYQDGQFVAIGLQDPLSDLSGVDERVSIHSTPFLSLDEKIIRQRIKKLLDEPNISVAVLNQTATLSGAAVKTPELQQKITFLSLLPGVSEVQDLTTEKLSENWQSFLLKHPPPDNLEVEKIAETLYLSGASSVQKLNEYIQLIERFGAVDSSAVETYTWTELQQLINNNPLSMTSPTRLNQQQKTQLDQIYQSYQRLLSIQQNVTIKLSAQSDCQGSVTKSNQFSQSRLALVFNYLIDSGMKQQHIMTELIECQSTSTEVNSEKIGVWFEVVKR